MFKVFYTHLKGYGVFRAFDTREDAEEFIYVNSLVCGLPGLRRVYPLGTDTTEV